MQEHHEEIARVGGQVVALGQGDAAAAAAFCAKLDLSFPCLGDPERAAYRSFDFGRGSWWGVVFQPFLDDPVTSFDRIRRADLKGSMTPGTDVLQLPGAAVVDRDGVVRYLHRAARTDDLPPMDEVLAALSAARPPAEPSG